MNSENVILFKNVPERGQQEFKIKRTSGSFQWHLRNEYIFEACGHCQLHKIAFFQVSYMQPLIKFVSFKKDNYM